MAAGLREGEEPVNRRLGGEQARRLPSREEAALSPKAASLLARIDSFRERLYREHGLFPDSGEVIRELRERGEE